MTAADHACANYLPPTTCLTAPSSEAGRCDHCQAAADHIPSEQDLDAALAVLLWLSETRVGEGRLRDAIALVRTELHEEMDR